tara:strand:- start:2066 stop:2395 length:330 start_codon:yes stop_codon:yes gene_type:complete
MEASTFIKDAITNNKVVLFMKGTAQFPQCGFSGQVIQILRKIGLKDIATVNVLEDDQVRQGIKDFSQWPTIPQLYVNEKFIGGADIITEMYESGELSELLKKESLLSAD